MPHIFISYAKIDTHTLAKTLYEQINGISGFSAWMDKSLESGESWALQIQDEIDRADLIIVLLSPDVNRRPSKTQRRSFVLNEIDYAQQGHKPILPIMAQTTKMPVQIAGLQFLDFRGNQGAAIESLLRRLERLRPSQEIQIAELAQVPTELEIKVPKNFQTNLSGRNIPIVAGFVSILAVVITAFIFLPPLFNNWGTSVDNPTLSETVSRDVSEVAAEEIFNTATDSHSPTTETSATNTDSPTKNPPRESTATVTPDPLQAALERARNFDSNLNNDWTPYFHTFEDGVEMALVPAGCFMMGSTGEQINYAVELGSDVGAERDWFNYEQPIEQICFEEAFWIDRYEVWQAQFQFLGGIKENNNSFVGDTLPVEDITWFEARDYCEIRRGGRLPTEAEWEYAARGVENLIFPWGNEFIADNAIYQGNSNFQTANVGSRINADSWVGVLGMSGNVWEWTNSVYQPDIYEAINEHENNIENETTILNVVRGGSWFDDDIVMRSAIRFWINPSEYVNSIGVRCARSLD